MKQDVPKWLKELQENSWELELLISGGAIFTLFQVSDIWINWLENMNIISFLPGRAVFLLLGTLGLETLKLGFILHLILRSFWLAMVCINYVFPAGINKEKIKWKKPFSIKVDENEDLQGPILFVDRLCGIVMFLSITSTFLLAGVLFTIFATVSLPIMFNINTGLIGTVLFFAFLAYLIDLISGGLLRKIPYLSYLTFPFFVLYDYLTFRKIYQKTALLFYTNITKWKFTLAALVFFTIALTFSYLNTYRTMRWPNLFDERAYRWQMTDNDLEIYYRFYKDELQEDEMSTFHIQSKIVKDNYLEFFVQYRAMFDELVTLLPGKEEEKFLRDIFEIKIDDSTYSNLEWISTYNKTPTNMGLTTLIPVNHLKNGKHIITLGCNSYLKDLLKNKNNRTAEMCSDFHIPFWKDTE
jgi:hypothetical protein